MMNGMERGGSRNEQPLWLSILPVGYADFIQIEDQIGWTTLYRIMHIAYNSFETDSWNLQARLFLPRAFLLDQFGGMTRNE
jgi:hypothetical protein